jgi:FtsH-binding integral membrane protein
MVAGLTAVVVLTRTDFSFLRTALTIGGFVALGLIIASIAFGFSLGLVFAAAMVIFASGSILYNTSKIMRTYRTDQPVAAALSLFSSIALLFWYVVSITSRRR